MAKLPKPKKSAQDEAAIDNEGVITPEEEAENTNPEEQTDALENLMSSATQNAAEAASEEEEHEDEQEDANDAPAVSEHSEDKNAEEEVDAGENPETAPPAKVEPVITVSAPAKKTPTKATTVKVATVCDHSCFIGGVPYHFKKGVPTSVPEPVKSILRNAGLLMAL